MRKNRLFILGIFTVMVALVSLSLVSGTWAKYTSTVSGSDSARVAYWGINKDKSDITIDLFSAGYDGTVQSNDAAKVIAPGTTQSYEVQFIYFEATAPEVDYKLTLSAAGSSASDAIKNNSNITWSFDGVDNLTWDQLIDAINAYTFDGEAGTINNIKEVIGWKWNFSASEAGDLADTAMGNDAHNLSVTIKITATAVQVD